MPKSRINKFIFKDGKIFLRLKATAMNLKLTKKESNYALEFEAGNEQKENVPVVFVDEFIFPQSIQSDLVHLDLEKVDVNSEPESWGEIATLKTSGKDCQFYYYLTPAKQKFAVRVGPIADSIGESELEIDWSNIQWGIE